jgi:hypothetical protein
MTKINNYLLINITSSGSIYKKKKLFFKLIECLMYLKYNVVEIDEIYNE